MYGAITKYRKDLGIGVIAAENGRKYRFQQKAILNRRDDLEGQEVAFDLASMTPQAIIVLAGSPWAAFGGLSA